MSVEAKLEQGYMRCGPVPPRPRCANCAQCEVGRWDDRMGVRGELLIVARDRKCRIGGFSVNANGYCARYEKGVGA